MELSIIMFFVCMVWIINTQLHYYTRAEIHTNFRNFFNAYADNNPQKALLNENIIYQETKQKQQTFDTMKEELQLARYKNSKKQIRNGNISTVFKRNILSTVSLTTSSVTPFIPVDLEKRIETIFEKEKVLVPKTHYRLLYDKIKYEEGYKEVLIENEKLKNDLSICQDKVDENEKYMWKVSTRVYLDDVEALYKPQYDEWKNKRIAEEKAHKDAHNRKKDPKEEYVPLYTTPSDRVDGRDPKAVRIRQKSEFWDWLTTTKVDQEKIKRILQEMEQQYRILNKIPEKESLIKDQKRGLEEFRKTMCTAIGHASETASFIIHGTQVLQLFKGRLEELHVFGKGVDEYIVPVLNALAPIIDKNKKCAVFQKLT